MNRRNVLGRVALFAALVASSLGATASVVAAEEASSTTSDSYKLAEPPKDANEVIMLRKKAKDQQDVVVVGRIGGRPNPWIKGAAAFSIVDRSLKPCNEIEGDTCKTPWDYCCEGNLPKATVLVMFVDGEGKAVKQDARELLGVKELDTLYVAGKAKRDKSGNVTVMASKVFVPTAEKEAAK